MASGRVRNKNEFREFFLGPTSWPKPELLVWHGKITLLFCGADPIFSVLEWFATNRGQKREEKYRKDNEPKYGIAGYSGKESTECAWRAPTAARCGDAWVAAPVSSYLLTSTENPKASNPDRYIAQVIRYLVVKLSACTLFLRRLSGMLSTRLLLGEKRAPSTAYLRGGCRPILEAAME